MSEDQAKQTSFTNRNSGETVRLNLKQVSMAVCLVATLLGVAGGWMIIPSQVAAQERRIISLEVDMKKNTETLIRIEERLITLQRMFEKGT